MRILVCYKYVRDENEISVNPDRTLNTDAASWVISPYDVNAVEAAMKLAEAAGESTPLGTVIRRASDVPGAGTRGVHEDLVLQPLAPQHGLEDPLSQRRTADITQTDK